MGSPDLLAIVQVEGIALKDPKQRDALCDSESIRAATGSPLLHSGFHKGPLRLPLLISPAVTEGAEG
ncbi:hypothetical protein NKG60_28180 [Mesorhizobium sp. M1428]|uniref:hypothetical protein n=1 Tax=Mesorhizobium sp. M1428 TaxID=2957102 RepID=UPI00333B87B5